MNISLIGMMGSGKTTIAKYLSVKLPSMTLIDMDSLIVKKQKMSINDIFTVYGEEFFRKIESEILTEILLKDNQIISTGGGIVKCKENIEKLKKNSFVIYLKASSDILFDRVKNDTERPLLNVSDMKSKIKVLLSERESEYNKADIIINTENKTPDIIINEILAEYKKYDKNRCKN